MNTTPHRPCPRLVLSWPALLALWLLLLAPLTGAGGVLPNVLVNNPALDATAADTQLESTLVLGTHNSIIAAYVDSASWDTVPGGANDHFIGISRSLNGGAIWEDLGRLPDTVRGDGFNPVLARGLGVGALADTIYLATTDFSANAQPSAIQVFTFFDNGLPFLPNAMGVITATAGAAGEVVERPSMTVDNFLDPAPPAVPKGQGNVYLVWRHTSVGGQTAIRFAKSTDNGNSFGGMTTVYSSPASLVNGPVVVVGPAPLVAAASHPIFVFWLEQTIAGGQNRIRMSRSDDQGAIWSAAITVVTLNTLNVDGDLRLQSGFRGNAFPRVAVNPNVLAANNNGLYLTFNDDPLPLGAADRANVYFVQSQASGNLGSWSATTTETALRVNEDPGTTDQFNPAIAISPNGANLFLGFYDRRRDPTNFLIDTFGRIGVVDAGGLASFATARGSNFLISTVSFPPVRDQDPSLPNNTFTGMQDYFMGSYDAAVADNTQFYFTWGDHRLSNPVGGAPLIHRNQPDIRFSAIPVAGPRGIIDVFTEGPSRGVTIGGGNGDNIIDYNECNTLTIRLINRGNSNVVAVSATLATLTPGVTVSQNHSVFADIAAGLTQASTMPFSITTSPSFLCGTPIDLTLTVSTLEAGTFVIPIRLNSGTPGPALTINALDTLPNPIPIPDNDGYVESIINVSGLTTPVASVRARMFIQHGFRSDLDVSLEAPDGTRVVLTADNGAGFPNYGASAANPIVFDDAAGVDITQAPLVPNLAGPFRPDQPLAAFIGRPGNGFWKLRVRDDDPAVVGTIDFWALEIAGAACTDGGGPCLRFLAAQVLGGNGNGRLDVNECADINVILTNVQATPYLGVSARLSTTTPGVTVVSANSAYPDIPAAGAPVPPVPTGTNLMPFRVSIPSGFPCGHFVEFVLHVTTQNDGAFDVPFRLQVGSCAPNPPYVAVAPAVPLDLPDLANVSSTILIPPGSITAPIGKVTVSVGITHSYVGDLRLRLTGPDGTFADLVVTDAGRPGVDYGTFTTLTPPFTCLVPTTFDDDAAISIRAGTAPYAGAFVPTGPTSVTPPGRGPLSVFTGKAGLAVNGTWTLQVTDGLAGDVGQLVCWSLSICEPEQYTPLTGNLPSKIPDNDSYTDIEIPVLGIVDPIQKVRVALRITHPAAPELDISLISPDGTIVNLSSDNGVVAGVTLPNYGFNNINPTVFDDDANASITVGNNVGGSFAMGTFRPEQPLAAFAGKSGPAVNGIWRLRVVDDTPGNNPANIGNVVVAQLHVFTATCTDGGGACAPNRELHVASEDPATGVPITVSLTDRNGDRDGTTVFTRTYGHGSTVTLTAPPTAPNGNTFVVWKVDGVPQTVGVASVTVTLDAARGATAVYAGPRLLTVNSLNAAAVPITVTPAPDGITPFSRLYANLTTVTLTAPPVAPNGYVFVRWIVDGVNRAAGVNPISLVMDTAHLAVAVYESPYRTLKVESEDPDSGVVINATPDFLGRAAGTTTFYREYLVGTVVTLEAPAVLPSGRLFKRWEIDDNNQPRGVRVINVTMDRYHEVQAEYESPTVELEVKSEDPDSGVSVLVTPDIHGRSAGVTTFEREYNRFSFVTLVAPPTAGNRVFKRWEIDDDDQPRGQRVITIQMDEDIEAEAEYEDRDNVLGNIAFALWFDGFNDQVRVPDSSSLRITGPLTIEAWVYRDLAGSLQTIVEKSGCPGDAAQVGGYALQVLANDRLRFEVRDSCTVVRGVTGATPLQPGTWYHVAGVWDGAQLRVYVNGVPDGNAAAASGPAAGLTPFLIGAGGNTTPARPMAGFIDELRVWRVARSQAELAGNSGSCLTGTEPGLAGYWRFNEEDSLVAHDSTPNLNHGLLLNGPLWVDSTVGCTTLVSPRPAVAPRAAPLPAPGDLRLTMSQDMSFHACRLTIQSAPGAEVIVEVSADLVNWAPLACIKNDSGECAVVDSMSPDGSRRFFRLRLAP